MPSNITQHTLKHTPLMFQAFSGFSVIKKRTEHSLFDDPDDLRVDCLAEPAGQNGLSRVTFSRARSAGDTIYLSYFWDEISSVRLTDPPPPGVTMFTTDNLSGCKFFVDRVTGSNDLIVYHANAQKYSPLANQGASFPKLETPSARTHLDNLHTNAINDWAGLPHQLALANGGSLDKPTYNTGADLIVRRKDNQGRTRSAQPAEPPDPNRVNKPEFLGGTVVFGFYGAKHGGTSRWRFYYQTWGAVEYRRPNTARKRWTSGRDFHPTTCRLLGYGRIYPTAYNRTLP